MQFQKIVGETYFEANLKAEREFGKDNFVVITSKKIKHPILFGLGHQEMIELTVGIPQKQESHIRTEAPTMPSPTVEVKKSTGFSSRFVEPMMQSSIPEPIIPPPIVPEIDLDSDFGLSTRMGSTTAPKVGIKAYRAQHSAPRTHMRKVHGIRGMQEGNQDPRPQKLVSKGLESTQIQSVLDEIIAVKETRQRQERIANKANVKTQAPQRQEQISQKKIDLLENKMSEIFSMLTKMSENSAQALNKSVPNLPEGLFHIKKNLLAVETPGDITDQLIFSLQESLSVDELQFPHDAIRATSDWLEKKLNFSSDLIFSKNSGPKIIVLIGPTGVGKTTTIAKLAASYGLKTDDRKSIALFTLDTFRIGAADQLQQYAQIIDADMEIIYSPEDIERAIPNYSDKDLIIVDTAGRCQKKTNEIGEMQDFLDKLPYSEKFLVLSATSKYTDMVETVKKFGHLNYDHLIFTKVDETNTIGPLLGLLYNSGKSLAYITNGQNVPDDFQKANFDFFNSRLFPRTSY
jgi:flagellar biosynthesis protein FlhF